MLALVHVFKCLDILSGFNLGLSNCSYSFGQGSWLEAFYKVTWLVKPFLKWQLDEFIPDIVSKHLALESIYTTLFYFSLMVVLVIK